MLAECLRAYRGSPETPDAIVGSLMEARVWLSILGALEQKPKKTKKK